MQIKDRIKEFRRVPSGELMANPLNHRVHPENQRKELRRVLKDIGFAGALLAREQDGKLVLIDGHLRADECKDAELPVLVLDVTEEEGNKILASYDALGSMAKIDQKILDDLIGSFSEDPFASEKTGEVIKPNDDIFTEEEKRKAEEEAKRQEESRKLKEGEAKFGVKTGDWWIVKPGRFVYCGDYTHPDFKAAITEEKRRGQQVVHYTVFINCPRDTEHEYRAWESFIDVSDECWTFTNNDPKWLGMLLNSPYASGVYTFHCKGLCQIAVLHTREGRKNLVNIGNHIEATMKQRGRKVGNGGKSIDFGPPDGGAVIIPQAIDYLIGKFRMKFRDKAGCVPKFICPSTNTGAIFRSMMNGYHSRCFMAEKNIGYVEFMLSNGYKFPGADRYCIKDGRPQRRDRWITQP